HARFPVPRSARLVDDDPDPRLAFTGRENPPGRSHRKGESHNREREQTFHDSSSRGRIDARGRPGRSPPRLKIRKRFLPAGQFVFFWRHDCGARIGWLDKPARGELRESSCFWAPSTLASGTIAISYVRLARKEAMSS